MIIEVDEYKKLVIGYDPDRSEDFHSASAKLADKEFEKYVKSGKFKRIIFMAGGTASGKTEFARSYLNKKDQLVYDGTLKNIDGFLIKERNIKKYIKNNPKIKIVFIIPKYLDKAFEVFKARERKMKDAVFFDTHIKSANTIAKILLEKQIRVEIYASELDYSIQKLKYKRIKILSRKKIANFLLNYSKRITLDLNLH